MKVDPIELLAFNAAELYSTSTIAAIHCDAGRDLRAMLTTCSPGDIVVEITALGCKGHPVHDAIGRLIAVRKEFVPFEDAQPEDAEQGYNCKIVRVLEEREFMCRKETDAQKQEKQQWVIEAIKRHNLGAIDDNQKD